MRNKNSKIYWQERSAKEKWKLYNEIEKENKELASFYKRALEDILKELSVLYVKIEEGTSTRTEIYNFIRLGGLYKNLDEIIKRLGENVNKNIDDRVRKAIEQAYKMATEEIGIDFALENENLIKFLYSNNWAGEFFSDRIWESVNDLANTLNKVIKMELLKGTSIINITAMIKKLLDSNFKNALRVARTETMHYLNSAALKGYKDAGCKKVIILAAKDERTCSICGKAHKKESNIDSAPILPLHPNCRCAYAPVM